MKFAQQRRFTPEQEAEICNLYATGQHSQHALARQFGCSQGTIARILKAKPKMNAAALQRRVAELEAALQKIVDRTQRAHPMSYVGDYCSIARAALKGGER